MSSYNSGFEKAFKHLADDIFACFIQEDYEDNLYLYEHRIHNSKQKCTAYLLKKSAHTNTPHLAACYNALIDSGLLRWRVKDKSVFAVCRDEMVAIAASIGTNRMSAQISAMEAIYQNVLMVTAKEPLSFFLFIQGLKALERACRELYPTSS